MRWLAIVTLTSAVVLRLAPFDLGWAADADTQHTFAASFLFWMLLTIGVGASFLSMARRAR